MMRWIADRTRCVYIYIYAHLYTSLKTRMFRQWLLYTSFNAAPVFLSTNVNKWGGVHHKIYSTPSTDGGKADFDSLESLTSKICFLQQSYFSAKWVPPRWVFSLRERKGWIFREFSISTMDGYTGVLVHKSPLDSNFRWSAGVEGEVVQQLL